MVKPMVSAFDSPQNCHGRQLGAENYFSKESEAATGEELLAVTRSGDIELLRLVSSTFRFDLLAEGRAALEQAATAGPVELLEHLLNRGHDTHPLDVCCAQHLALMAACRAGNRETAYFLCELLGEGVDLHGARALVVASRGGHLEILRNLVEKSTGIDKLDGSARSRILTAAIENRHLQVIQYLSGLIPLSESGLKAEDIPDQEAMKFHQFMFILAPQSVPCLTVQDKIDQDVKEYLQFWHLCELNGLPGHLVKTAYETGEIKEAIKVGLILNAEEITRFRKKLSACPPAKDLRI